MAPPVNDNFANATDLPGDSGQLTGQTNVDATLEAGEPANFSGYGTHSIWYKITPVADGNVTVSTTGSTRTDDGNPGAKYDTVLDVFTGSAVNALTLVGGNDEEPDGGYTSSFTFAATAGTTYYARVLEWYDGTAAWAASSAIVINWSGGGTVTEPPPPPPPPPDPVDPGPSTLFGNLSTWKVLETSGLTTATMDDVAPWNQDPAFDDSAWVEKTNGIGSEDAGAIDGREFGEGVCWNSTYASNDAVHLIRFKVTLTQADLDSGVRVSWGMRRSLVIWINGTKVLDYGSTQVQNTFLGEDFSSAMVVGENLFAIGSSGEGADTDQTILDQYTWMRIYSRVLDVPTLAVPQLRVPHPRIDAALRKGAT